MNDKIPSKSLVVWNVLGGVSGIIALLTIVFYGGALAEQVKSLHVRVSKLEIDGGQTIQAHIGLDLERDKAITDRVNRIEGAVLNVPAELSRINANLEYLKVQVSKIENRP